MKPFLLLALALATPALAQATPALAQTRAAGQARLDAEFARTDRNHDGFVSRDELARRLAHLSIAGRPVRPQETKTLADYWFARADADHDGRISRDEARALYRQTFARFDANHDGRIDAREREAAQASLMAEAMR